MLSLDARIHFAIEDAKKELSKAPMDNTQGFAGCGSVLAALKKEERCQRRADKVKEKLERARQEAEGHRLRVHADRLRFEGNDALFRAGCSPGERTRTSDWNFWHNFDVDSTWEV